MIFVDNTDGLPYNETKRDVIKSFGGDAFAQSLFPPPKERWMNMNELQLKQTANEVRKGIITAVYNAKAGHPGGSLSAADMFTYLYFEEMNIDPANPDAPDRDRFVLSKGHTAPG